MQYEWDEAKAQQNRRKHGIRFADAVVALEDNLAITIEDDTATSEERFLTLGRSDASRVLLVVWCMRCGDVIRIISARRATANERRQFWKGVEP